MKDKIRKQNHGDWEKKNERETRREIVKLRKRKMRYVSKGKEEKEGKS